MDTFHAESVGKEVIEKLGSHAVGKTYLITGTSNGGIGSEVATTLATAKPKLLILAARNEAKVTPVTEAIKTIDPNVQVAFLYLDLLDNSTVRAAIDKVKTITTKIDGLINNAGIMAPKAYSTSKDGVESQFATNHLGHFLLTNLLLKEGLIGGEGSIIVNLGSLGYQLAETNVDDINYSDGKDYYGWKGYGQAKTANLLFTYELAERLRAREVPVLAVHPGVITGSQLLANSAVDQEWFGEGYKLAIERNGGNPLPEQHVRSLTQAAATVISALLDPSIRSKAPAFLVEHRVLEPLPYATNSETAKKLWAVSEKLVGEKFDV